MDRPQETSQSKSSMAWQALRGGASDGAADKKPSDRPSGGSVKKSSSEEEKKEEKRHAFRRVRSPSRPRAWLSSSYKPRFGGFHRPGFVKEDHSFYRKPPAFPFQRNYHYHHFSSHNPGYMRDRPIHYLVREKKVMEWERLREKEKEQEREKQRERKKLDREKERERTGEFKTSSPSKENTAAFQLQPLFPRSRSASSREKDRRSSTVSQERERDHGSRERDPGSRERDPKGSIAREKERSRDREPQSAASLAAARNRAIQNKRKEIEEVYQQDCDTFGVVVRMLIEKDPSLERLIQTSLQENLREVGLRCVEAMEKFIEDYDSRELPVQTPSPFPPAAV